MKGIILTYSAKRNLKSTVRPIIRKLITDKSRTTLDLGHKELQYLIDTKNKVVFRVVWFVIVALCTGICCYQITDRIIELFKYPTAVDIYMGPVTSTVLPRLKLCSVENDYVISKMDDNNPFLCGVILMTLLRQNDTNVTALFNWDGPSTTYQGYELSMNASVHVKTEISQTLFGQCTSVSTDDAIEGKLTQASIKIIMTQGKLCSPSVRAVSISDVIEFQALFPVADGYEYAAKIGFRKHYFLNTPIQPCVTPSDFKKCYDKCIVDRLLKEVPCRLPFFQVTEEMPLCQTAEAAKSSFYKAINITLKPEVFGICGCLRQCSDRAMVLYPNILPRLSNETYIIVSADENEITLTERLAYDTSNLAADIGGNLGLFLGLSILSIINLVFIAAKVIKTQFTCCAPMKKRTTTRHYNNMQQFVTAVYKKYIQNKKSKIEENTQISSKMSKVFRLVITVVCICLAVFMIRDRVKYYFTYPVRYDVKVKPVDNVTFPSFTFCGASIKIIKLKMKFAKKNNITNWCDVDTYDLLFDKYELKSLLKKTELYTSPLTKSQIQFYSGLEPLNGNVTNINTYLGVCKHLRFVEDVYAGFFSLYIVLIMALHELNECYNNYYEYFYDDLGSTSYNILTRAHIPQSTNTFLDFKLERIVRLNIPQRPCINHQTFKQCKQNCFLNQLQQQKGNLCSLPFIEETGISDLNICTSPEMAKQSRDLYERILINVTLGTTCSCTRLCEENIITIALYSHMEKEIKPNPVLIGMTSNEVQTIIEVADYSLIALFGDIGNCLGLAVGMSVLAAAKYARYPLIGLQYLCTKIIAKCKCHVITLVTVAAVGAIMLIWLRM